MAVKSYNTAGVCALQLNRLTCDGVPMTVVDGDSNVILVAGAGDATEIEYGKTYEEIAAQTDGPCLTIPASKFKTGESVTWRHCSTTFIDLMLTFGLDDPRFDPDGNICGWASPDNGSGDSCCNCGDASCEDGDDFSITVWQCALDCDGNQIKDDDGNPLYEICVFTRVTDVTPQQNARKSTTPSNNRVDYSFTLQNNDGFGEGPGCAFKDESIYNAAGATEGTAALTFLSTIAPPLDGSCPCDVINGCFITAASILAGGPVPVGENPPDPDPLCGDIVVSNP